MNYHLLINSIMVMMTEFTRLRGDSCVNASSTRSRGCVHKLVYGPIAYLCKDPGDTSCSLIEPYTNQGYKIRSILLVVREVKPSLVGILDVPPVTSGIYFVNTWEVRANVTSTTPTVLVVVPIAIVPNLEPTSSATPSATTLFDTYV